MSKEKSQDAEARLKMAAKKMSATDPTKQQQYETGKRYAERLTDSEKSRIIADYIECGNLTEVARRYNTNYKNIRYVVNHNINLQADINKHQKQITEDVVRYMDSKKQAACSIIDLYMSLLQDKSKTEKASIRDIAVSLGIVIDKFTKDGVNTSNEKSEHRDIVNAIYDMCDKIDDECSQDEKNCDKDREDDKNEENGGE